MSIRDVVFYFALFALIYLGGRWVMDRKARKAATNDPIARQLRAFSDEFNRGR